MQGPASGAHTGLRSLAEGFRPEHTLVRKAAQLQKACILEQVPRPDTSIRGAGLLDKIMGLREQEDMLQETSQCLKAMAKGLRPDCMLVLKVVQLQRSFS